MFTFNPCGSPQTAEACGLTPMLPNHPVPQPPPSYPSAMPAPVAPVIDSETVQELTKAINNMTTSAQLQQQEIQKQHNENILLRNNI